MKILIVHNNYGKYSGEEAVVDKMHDMFRNHGYEVKYYRLTTEGQRNTITGKIRGFFCGFYSPKGIKGLRQVLKAERPDVVNVHNLYPFISPAALFECKKLNIPVIMSVHNFRLICPTGLFSRNGVACEYCAEHKNEWGCVKFNCENSMFKSIGYASRNWFARKIGAYSRCVDYFACITNFQRKKLISAGFSPDKISVIPNSIDALSMPKIVEGTYVAFCGRISSEKGVDLIIEVAKRHPEISFKFAGAIRESSLVENKPKNVELLGYLTGDQLKRFYHESAFVLMASRCYEGFPVTILEAAQLGKTTLAPNHGGFTEIIGEGDNAIGRLFKPADVNDLETQLIYLWSHPEIRKSLAEKAYRKLTTNYSTEVVFNQWKNLIHNVIDKKEVR